MRLKQVRMKRGLSQSDLATMAGLSVRTLQHYEQGNRNIDGAGLETLTALAIALSCPITELLNSDELIKQCRKTSL